jgi:translation initiation factor 2 subunit 2
MTTTLRWVNTPVYYVGKIVLNELLKNADAGGGVDADETFTVDEEDDDGSGVTIVRSSAPSEKTWLSSDRDYTYDELLTRVFEIMHAKNPEMASGTKQKFVMRPPQVLRVGTKKTSFVNFKEICKM